jgi:hypothetical protein
MLATAVSPVWGLAGAVVTVTGALAAQTLVRVREARDHRRNEYSRAFDAALAWTEFPYRIARRLSNEREDVAPLVAAMHETQQRLYYHSTWLRSVSPAIGVAYERLIAAIREKTAPFLAEAWAREPWRPGEQELGRLFLIDIETETAAFVQAVRRDVSFSARLAISSEGAALSYSSRFKRIFGGRPIWAWVSGVVVALSLLAQHEGWILVVVVGVLLLAPTGVAVKATPAADRVLFVAVSAVLLALLLTLAFRSGPLAAALGAAVFCVVLYGRGALVREKAVDERPSAQQGMLRRKVAMHKGLLARAL